MKPPILVYLRKATRYVARPARPKDMYRVRAFLDDSGAAPLYSGHHHTWERRDAVMPKYVIEREVPNAGRLSSQELRTISQKSCSVLN